METNASHINLDNPWTNVYGLARAILAFGTFLTLTTNRASVLFYDTNLDMVVPRMRTVDVYTWNFFSLFSPQLEIARLIAILILVIIISGWRPRFTGLLHVWVSLSFIQLSPFVDGGDQITAVLTILLLPICLTDPRKWHWEDLDIKKSKSINSPYLLIFCISVYFIIRVQMAVIYLNAATAKLGVNEWLDGTAVWYWFKDYDFGYNIYIAKIMDPILRNPVSIALLTWGSIIFEFILFLGLLIEKKYKHNLLISGLIFHLLIVIVHGLFSFFFAMAGGLILYLRPFNQPYELNMFKVALVKIKRYLIIKSKFGINRNVITD